MSTVNPKKKIVPKAILKIEETETPDSTVSNDTPEEAQLKPTPNNKGTYKSKRKTPLKEFAFENNLRPEILSGFKVWLEQSGNSEFHFDSEWTTLLDEYKNRTL